MKAIEANLFARCKYKRNEHGVFNLVQLREHELACDKEQTKLVSATVDSSLTTRVDQGVQLPQQSIIKQKELPLLKQIKKGGDDESDDSSLMSSKANQNKQLRLASENSDKEIEMGEDQVEI